MTVRFDHASVLDTIPLLLGLTGWGLLKLGGRLWRGGAA